MEMLGKAIEIGSWNFEGKKQLLKRKLEQLVSVEADIIVELQNAESRHGKKPKNEVENWLSNVKRVKQEVESIEQENNRGRWSMLLMRNCVEKSTEEVDELIEQRNKIQGTLLLDVQENDADALLAPELVGQAFQLHLSKIQEHLVVDEVSIIGIYGMGGVGKTTLVVHIHNELLQRRRNVCWISVSQDFSISNLQNCIAKTIGFDLSNEDDDKKRAAKLSKALTKRGDFVLILDDLWNHFPLEKVGIPIEENGCKLVLTTRSLDICWRMGCQKTFKIEPLSPEEAWNLFEVKIGEVVPTEVKPVAKSIVKECGGLPLGIIAVAGSMRGVRDISEWRNVLTELKESKVGEGDMELEVFQVLKFSYNRLTDSALQQCFLYCALYPADHKIRRENLIELLIDEGVIAGGSRRQIEYDKGHTMLNRLEKVCLLESCMELEQRCVKMHDLVRDMAIRIMKTESRVIVEAGEQLFEVPSWRNWAEDLVRVSLMNNQIEEIPSGYSPRCPNLSTLLLSRNNLKSIADSFFIKLQGLTVLDLSYTGIKVLPNSISDLVNLSALLLKGCNKLKRVPSLAQLRALKKLEMSYTEVGEVPQGIELLFCLEYLDLSNSKIEELPMGILPDLSCLQVLKLNKVKAHEVASLRKLETLECRIYDVSELNTFTASSRASILSQYFLVVTQSKPLDNVLPRGMKEVYFSSCCIGKGDKTLLLPKDLQYLNLFCCNIKTSILCLKNSIELKSFTINLCPGIHCLLSLSSSPSVFQSLEDVYVSDLKDLHFLFGIEGVSEPLATATAASPLPGTFSRLKKFNMWGCPSLKKLFPPGLSLNLQNLEEFSVHYCKNMEELIATEEGQQDSQSSNSSIQLNLPKLKYFSLSNLPELKKIICGKIICCSVTTIYIDSCMMLKRIPFSLILVDNEQQRPLPSLEKIKVFPRSWWDSVELDRPEAKNVLLPLCHFSPF